MEALQRCVDSPNTSCENSILNDAVNEVAEKHFYDTYYDMLTVDTRGLIVSDSAACYDRKIFQSERREELLERMLNSLNTTDISEKIVEYDECLGREIYAFSVYDGKVHISGNEGFEYKAITYEKLINASLNKSWSCLFNGVFVDESKLVDTVESILKYYMDIDRDYRKNNKNDSITNHVDEVFQSWCRRHKQKEIQFDGRA